MTNLDIPTWLRYRPATPPPRDVEVIAEEHHCDRECEHLYQAWERGFAAGVKATREHQETTAGAALATMAVWAFFGGVFAAALIRLFLVGR